MAEVSTANMEVRSPQSSSFTGNYKKYILNLYNKEETSQDQPLSPQNFKETSAFDDTGPCAFMPVHPKKRLRKEQDDPMLAEAAASPLSSSKPSSPMSVLKKIEDCRSPTSDIHLFSAPNSPYSNLQSTLDSAMFSEPPYSPISIFSPSHYPFSPVSESHMASAIDIFAHNSALRTGQLARSSIMEKGPKTINSTKGMVQLGGQKECPRPQSVALDLTSFEKHKSVPHSSTYQNPSLQQQPRNQPPYSTLSLVGHQSQSKIEIRTGSQSLTHSQSTITHITQPQVSPHVFEKPATIISSHMYPHIAYNQGNQQPLIGNLTSRQARIPRFKAGGGVIRPTPTHLYHKPLQNLFMHHPSHQGKFPYPYPPAGNPSKRMPSEMIYNQQGFPRDLPNVPLQPPTASSKKVDWLQSESREEDNVTYDNKPIHMWGHQDVMYYIFDSIKELNIKIQDVNPSELSNVTGKDLLQMSMADFYRFLPQTAEPIYRHFRARVENEKRRQAPTLGGSSHQDFQNNRINLDPSPLDFIQQPNNNNNFFQPPHQPSHQQPSHHLQQPQPILMREPPRGIDAAAPYELRYETVDARSIGLGGDGPRQHFIPESLPSASRKSFNILDEDPWNDSFDMDGNISDPDQSDKEEETKPEPPPKKRGPGRPRKPENELKKKKKKTGRLWEFIRNLLHDRETCPSMVRWENPEEGIFRFVQAEKVAQRWGERKQNKEMNYEKLSRAMRYYYKGEVFEAVLGRRLVYKFGKNAKNWRPSNPNFVNHGP